MTAPFNAYPYRDKQCKEPIAYCDECEAELYDECEVYDFCGMKLCPSCFNVRAVNWIQDFPEAMDELLN